MCDGIALPLNPADHPGVLAKSLYVDQSGVFSNHLIAVTSTGSGTPGVPKGVWRVDAQQNATLITNINTLHLEGVITLTNDIAKWGPWAGKILTGDEDQRAIYAISTNGVVTTNFLGIDPEDFDIIPANVTSQNLYVCDPDRNMLLKLPGSYLTSYAGDLLITDAGEVNPLAKLFIVHWDAAITNLFSVASATPAALNTSHLRP